MGIACNIHHDYFIGDAVADITYYLVISGFRHVGLFCIPTLTPSNYLTVPWSQLASYRLNALHYSIFNQIDSSCEFVDLTVVHFPVVI